MGKISDVKEIIGAIFSVIVFLIIGSVIIGSLAEPTGLAGPLSLIFVLGAGVIGFALIIKILKLFELI